VPIVQAIEPRRGPTMLILAFSRRASYAAGRCRGRAGMEYERELRAEKTRPLSTREGGVGGPKGSEGS
jgi:hypothetical protein